MHDDKPAMDSQHHHRPERLKARNGEAPVLREFGIAIAVMGGVSLILGLITPATVLKDIEPSGIARYASRELLEVILGLAAIVIGTCMAIRPKP